MGQRINAAGVALIKHYEGLRLQAYRCPAGVWTIGWGHTEGVHQGASITESQAEQLLAGDLAQVERKVAELTAGVELNAHQFAALVSFTFNLGAGAFAGSLLLRCLRAGDFGGAGRCFSAWVHAGPAVLPGLVARRAAESALFAQPVGPA